MPGWCCYCCLYLLLFSKLMDLSRYEIELRIERIERKMGGRRRDISVWCPYTHILITPTSSHLLSSPFLLCSALLSSLTSSLPPFCSLSFCRRSIYNYPPIAKKEEDTGDRKKCIGRLLTDSVGIRHHSYVITCSTSSFSLDIYFNNLGVACTLGT